MVCRWSPPPPDLIKLNVDAHIMDGIGVGFGVVARDSAGQVVGMTVCRNSQRWDAAMAEASALKFGVLVAGRLGFRRVIVESDDANAVRCIEQGVHGYAPIFLLYDAVREARNNFNVFSISHVKRAGNTVTYLVARWEIEMDSESVWFDSFPQSILALAGIDLI